MSKHVYGFIGLGQMGGPMATNIARHGASLICYDKAGTDGRVPDGASAAESVAQLAQQCDTIFLSLPDGPICLSVAQEIGQVTERKTQLVVDLSTVGPSHAKLIHAELANAGVDYADGPVSGGRAGAAAATIALMWAGSPDAFKQHKPILESFTGNLFNVGEKPGQGQALKLLNNFLSATAMAATSEAMHFGATQGLDMKTMLDVVNVSSGQNTATSDKFLKRVMTETFDAGFSTGLMRKDVGLFMKHVREEKTPHIVGDTVESIWADFESAMGAGSDFTQIHPFTLTKKDGEKHG
jgi:3-hydroxyisobutyrate dehydrogenase-like beta-hydroxyacid dehydrogenase